MPTQTDYILIGLGVLTAIILVSYIPSIVSVSSLSNFKQLSLENINGIDINALRICKQNEFI